MSKSNEGLNSSARRRDSHEVDEGRHALRRRLTNPIAKLSGRSYARFATSGTFLVGSNTILSLIVICGVFSSSAAAADALDPAATDDSDGAGNAPGIGAAEGLRCCFTEEAAEAADRPIISERIRSI